MNSLLVFTLSDLRCALRLSDTERILPAVAVTPVPKAPALVTGLINVYGRVIPVVAIRKLLRLPEREMTVNDRLIIARTANFPVAIAVDGVLGVIESAAEEIIAPAGLYPGLDYLEGVTPLVDGILCIYNLDRFLSLDDKSRIEKLLTGAGMPAGNKTA